MVLFAQISIEYELFLKRSIWSTGQNLTDTTTLGQSGRGINVNKGVLYTPQIFKTGALQSDAL